MKILECKKLNIGYNNKSVCKDISFSVESGDYICIMGENGSGKSTLIKTILGLITPISGKINLDQDYKKSDIGYVPQQTDFQKDFPASVNEVIMSGFASKMGLRPFYNKAEKAKANKVMEYLNITDLAKKSYRDLSGGQQQRVLLARAICATDSLLIMDEPTNGLDARTMKKFYDLISDLNSNGMTIIMVSHSIDNVLKYASKILYLKDTLVFSGSAEEFKSSELTVGYKIEGENK